MEHPETNKVGTPMKTIRPNLARIVKRMLKVREDPEVSAVDAIVRLLKENQSETGKARSSDVEQERQGSTSKR